MGVEQVDPGVGDRLADRRAVRCLGTGAVPGGDVDGRFGRAVQVVQRSPWQLRLEAPHQMARQGFAAAHHLAQPLALASLAMGQEHVQHRRDEVQRGDTLGLDHFAQVRRIAMATRTGHHQPRTSEQRPEEFPHRDVEAERGLLQHRVRRAQRIGVLHPQQAVDHRAMLVHHALGQTGGTRGVDDVGQMAGMQARDLRIAGRLRGEVFVFEHHHPGSGRRQTRLQGPLGQHHGRGAVFQHVGQTVGRVIRVERHVGGARLQNAQQRCDHVRAAVHANRHAVIRANAQFQQAMGNLVSALVQLGVAQLLLFEHHGDGIRTGRDPCLEQAMQGQALRIVDGRRIERFQQVLALNRRHALNFIQRRLGCLLQCGYKVFEGGLHVLADALRTDSAHHLHHQAETFAPIIHGQRQRVVGAFFTADGFDTLPRRHHLRGDFDRAMAIIEHGTEQRRRCHHATATLGQRQRSVLMTEQCGEPLMGGSHTLPHIAPHQAHPQRQGIDEHAQRMIGALSALHPTQQHRAEHHLVASADTAQHLCPGQVHQARRADTQLTRLAAKTPAKPHLQRQPDLFHAVTVALHIAQTERQRRFIDIAKHVAEERFVLLLADPEARLGHVIAIRHRGTQLIGPAEQVGLHFPLQHLQRGMVQHRMMEQQHRNPALVGDIFCVHQAQQRRLAQIQPIPTGIETLIQLCNHLCAVSIRFECLADELRPTPHDLHRFVEPLPGHRCPEDVMAIDHLLQRLGEAVQTGAAVKTEQRLQHVGITAVRGQMVIQNAFLQRRQRVDVLDIARATRHARHDSVDGVLAQNGQWQHVRRDPLATFDNGAGRHDHITMPTHRSGQRP